jgi:2-iminobutanoate/2-iminopropanoate deaminase
MLENKTLQSVVTSKAPSAIGPYSQGIITGDLLFISGQLPVDPATGEFVAGDIQALCHQCLKNVEAVAIAAGTRLERAVKMTVFLTDMADFAQVNEVYAHYFKDPAPARSAFQVAGLPKNARIEIEAICKL